MPFLFFSQTVWNEAAQVVFDEIMIIRSSFPSRSLDGGSGGPDAVLFNTVYQALLSMNDFCIHLPLVCKSQSAFFLFYLIPEN